MDIESYQYFCFPVVFPLDQSVHLVIIPKHISIVRQLCRGAYECNCPSSARCPARPLTAAAGKAPCACLLPAPASAELAVFLWPSVVPPGAVSLCGECLCCPLWRESQRPPSSLWCFPLGFLPVPSTSAADDRMSPQVLTEVNHPCTELLAAGGSRVSSSCHHTLVPLDVASAVSPRPPSLLSSPCTQLPCVCSKATVLHLCGPFTSVPCWVWPPKPNSSLFQRCWEGLPLELEGDVLWHQCWHCGCGFRHLLIPPWNGSVLLVLAVCDSLNWPSAGPSLWSCRVGSGRQSHFIPQ